MTDYYTPDGGLPPQTTLHTGRAIFKEAYAFIPKGVMTDIVTSRFPNWDKTRAWILAKPLSGFAETFSQYIMEVRPKGGSLNPEPEVNAEGFLFVVSGQLDLDLDGAKYKMLEGGYAYISPNSGWKVVNSSTMNVTFHWIRKYYEKIDGFDVPDSFVTNEKDIDPGGLTSQQTNGIWSATYFVDPEDLRHDCHVNIVNFEPGGVIPFEETHVMEHGLYVLEGKAVYRLNEDWVEVEAGDFIWLRAFCPQACYAAGSGRFRYLLYKDVNRHPKLKL
jgi:(S)-ureidoglycine aminohydrolase